ncbi:hypothetical protein SMALB_0920 [Streptomyces malaysiensis]|uniref:Uncharacterized protein n=1 Tax=Streptomyces malaysiensis TaxID=92644 RepID=A0A7X5WZ93_STRMQ|nr:hypothetical protein [Streptomyces malaysiensis]
MGAHGADAVQIAKLTRGETGEQFEIIDTGPEQCIGQTMSDSVVSEDIEKLAPFAGTAAPSGCVRRHFPGTAHAAHIDHPAIPSRPGPAHSNDDVAKRTDAVGGGGGMGGATDVTSNGDRMAHVSMMAERLSTSLTRHRFAAARPSIQTCVSHSRLMTNATVTPPGVVKA